MKPFLFIFGILVAGVLGYSFEPKLRSALTREVQSHAKPTSSGAPERITIDLGSLAPNQLPQKVTLDKNVQFSEPSSGLKLYVGKGTEVTLVRINGKNTVVRPDDTTYLIEVPV